MPREIVRSAGIAAAIGTSWTPLIPASGTVPTGETYVVRVSLANGGSSPDTIRASLLDAADSEVAVRLPDTSVGVGEVVEFSVRVPEGYKLAVRASVGGQVDALVVEGVRQY